MKLPVSLTAGSVVEFTDDMPKTAFSYVRFSTPQQSLGDSLRRQVEAAETFCKENGYTLDRSLTLHDKGVSAFRGDNVEIGRLGEFLRLVKSGVVKKGSALCVENLDRLSRGEITDALGLLIDLIRSGITVITLTDKHLYNRESINRNPGELMASIVFLMRANDESRTKSIRVKEAYDQRKKEAAEHGVKLLAWCPPWCDFDKETYVVDKGRAGIIKRVFDEYLKGNGPFRISRMFNAENVPTLGHRGFKEYKNTSRQWYKKVVRDILTDKRVYGHCHFLEKDNYFPVVVSKTTFDAVQNRLSLRANAEPTGGPSEAVGNLFTTLCRCAHCGGVMSKVATTKTYKNKKTRYEYLVCETARSGKGCSYKSTPYDMFEQELLAAIQTDTFLRAMSNHNPNKADEIKLEALQGEKVTNEKQIEKLTGLILGDDKPSVTLTTKLKQFEARQIQLVKDIQLLKAKLSSTQIKPAHMKEVIEHAGQLNKTRDGRLKLREFIRSTIDRINVDTKLGVHTINFKSGFVGSLPVFVGEETEAEDGSIRVNLTGGQRLTIK